MQTEQSVLSVRTELRAAIYDRHMHSSECPHWDYESNGGCLECDEHDARVAALLARVVEFQGDEATIMSRLAERLAQREAGR